MASNINRIDDYMLREEESSAASIIRGREAIVDATFIPVFNLEPRLLKA